MKIFGPVPSRRLGKSLGINNIPPKKCSYSCAYCQVGTTLELCVKRQAFFSPEELESDVRQKVARIKERKGNVDYLSFVPDGEPTLDINLGKTIKLLRSLGIKIAVITNASLIDRDDVIDDLQGSDLVSIKVDCVNEKAWRNVNRPHRALDLCAILAGILEFRKVFEGEIITETMFLKGMNDNREEIKGIAGFLKKLNPGKSYISIPTRPPAIKGVMPAGNQCLNTAYQVFREHGLTAEYLISYEGDDFGFTGDLEQDLLGITSVHPMREDAVREYLRKAGAGWEVVANLVKEGALTEVDYQGEHFYLRRPPRKTASNPEH